MAKLKSSWMVVFAAAATEILPLVMHGGSPSATLIGGAIGVGVMLGLKAAENRFVPTETVADLLAQAAHSATSAMQLLAALLNLLSL